MINLPRIPVAIPLLMVVACAQTALPQNQVSWIVPNGNWSVPANWDTGSVPDTFLDELANISNGGTAMVIAPIGTAPGQIVLGQPTDESGTLHIANGGNLAVTFTPNNVTNGGVNVG
jgi:hypothetical protein